MRRSIRFTAVAAVAAALLAACGSTSSSSTSTSSSAQPIKGGTAYFAEQPGATPSYIFPITPSSNFSVNNLAQFQILMYRPLYYFGVGNKAEINYNLSIADKPVFSNGDKTVTVTLKHYQWSNGTPVTARDVIFFINLLKANKSNWGAYVPGAFPDNVVSATVKNADTVVLQLNQAYNPTWFTYNELSQITPLPMAWDRTSLSQAAPNPNAANLPDTTTSGAKAVYSFLNSQASKLSTYATSPVWSMVDGPWKLSSFTIAGKAVFVPNAKYSGPDKPKLAEFVELPFTTASSEFNVLRAGNNAISYGYLPTQDLTQKASVQALGYSITPWTDLGFDFWPINFNNPTYGPVFQQLYVRQAFEHLVDQPAWINHFLDGYGVSTASPVPTQPSNPFADSTSKTIQYPYSTSAAKNLLTSHGWKLVNGIMTCESPGTSGTECGANIPKGRKMTFNMIYAAGVTSLSQEMVAFSSAAKQVGIVVSLSTAPFNTVISDQPTCTASQSDCSWQMVNWGGGWEYSPDNYPTGGEVFGSGAGHSGFGNYANTTANQLITATHTATAANAQSALDAYQNFMDKTLPVIYQPYPDYSISLISKKLGGVTQNPYLNLAPETWYFTK